MFTEREKDVLELLKKGYTNKLIANELNITPYTVKAHLSSIYYKLDVHSRVNAVIKYIQLNNFVIR